jgi:hypothetical protein
MRGYSNSLRTIVQNTLHTQSPVAITTGRNEADFTRILYEMARGRTISIWVKTSGMPAEVRALVSEMNCLCVTLPPDWRGDLAQLGNGSVFLGNKVDFGTRSNDTCISVGGGQVELDYWKQRGLECLHSQLPVLFLHRDGWTLVVYEWEPCEVRLLESLIQKSGPNFDFDQWLEDSADASHCQHATTPTAPPTRPELYVSGPLLCADWDPVDDKDVEASCARVLG